MNSKLLKGLIVGVAHLALVASLAAKYSIDRATQPRVWVRTAPVDPNLPIRGRYVSLRLEVSVAGVTVPEPPAPVVLNGGRTFTRQATPVPVSLEVRDAQLVVTPPRSGHIIYLTSIARADQRVAVLNQPVAYFIPEHVVDPSQRAAGEELWAEVTIPSRGAPRPIRLGVKKDGVLTPLEVR